MPRADRVDLDPIARLGIPPASVLFYILVKRDGLLRRMLPWRA